MDVRKETQKAFENILDTITCGDGGERFLKFRLFIREFDKRAADGDKEAEKIVDLIRQFSKLIDIAQK